MHIGRAGKRESGIALPIHYIVVGIATSRRAVASASIGGTNIHFAGIVAATLSLVIGRGRLWKLRREKPNSGGCGFIRVSCRVVP